MKFFIYTYSMVNCVHIACWPNEQKCSMALFLVFKHVYRARHIQHTVSWFCERVWITWCKEKYVIIKCVEEREVEKVIIMLRLLRNWSSFFLLNWSENAFNCRNILMSVSWFFRMMWMELFRWCKDCELKSVFSGSQIKSGDSQVLWSMQFAFICVLYASTSLTSV